LHSAKQDSQILSTEEGIQIDESDEHFENAQRLMHERVEPDSNVSVERKRQPSKQKSPICLSAEGIEIAESDEESENAASSMHKSFEPHSNPTDERGLH
jgi:hypothetical protein